MAFHNLFSIYAIESFRILDNLILFYVCVFLVCLFWGGFLGGGGCVYNRHYQVQFQVDYDDSNSLLFISSCLKVNSIEWLINLITKQVFTCRSQHDLWVTMGHSVLGNVTFY